MEISCCTIAECSMLPSAGEEKSNNSKIGGIIVVIGILFVIAAVTVRILDNKKRDKKHSVRPWKGGDN